MDRDAEGSHVVQVGRAAACHPDRIHVAGGLCRRCYDRKWRRENAAKSIASTQRWRVKFPRRAALSDKRSRAKIRWRYQNDVVYRHRFRLRTVFIRLGLTRSRHALNATDAVGLYEGILGAQGGACAICRADTPRVDRSLFCLDHDHDSGRVRGLLCVKCNVGLGTFQDDPKVLQAAIDYLKEHGK